jgi:hypothetical protein
VNSASEIIHAVSSAGGQLWLVDDARLRYRLPEILRPMVDVLREHKVEIVELLARRPAMPAGVRLIRWEPKPAPVRLSECETVTDTEKFIRSTLRQLEAALGGRSWQAGNWGLSGLLDRLAVVGCVVVLDDPRRALQ